MDKRQKALVLSGGGGRGAYHVGVLRFLEEHDWKPDAQPVLFVVARKPG